MWACIKQRVYRRGSKLMDIQFPHVALTSLGLLPLAQVGAQNQCSRSSTLAFILSELEIQAKRIDM